MKKMYKPKQANIIKLKKAKEVLKLKLLNNGR